MSGLFWVFFAVYSVYWGSFWYISSEKRNLIYVDYAVSLYFGLLIIIYLMFGMGLIKQIQENYDALEGSNGKEAPGIKQIKWILLIMCFFMFLRMGFESMPDVAKTYKVMSVSKETPYWPVTLAIISITNILAAIAVYVSIYLIHDSECEIEEWPETIKLVNKR